MNLDGNFFENIKLESVRGKFYKKQDVDALLKDIETRAQMSVKDNEILTLKLENVERKLQKLGDAEEAARELSRNIVDEANREADEILQSTSAAADKILENANAEAEKIKASAKGEGDRFIATIETKKDELKENLINSISSAWKSFLETENFPAGTEADGAPTSEELTEKVGLLAKALSEIETIEEENQED